MSLWKWEKVQEVLSAQSNAMMGRPVDLPAPARCFGAYQLGEKDTVAIDRNAFDSNVRFWPASD